MNTGRTFQVGRDPDSSGLGRPRTPRRGVPARAGAATLNRQRGLSLVEILVTVALLVVIILGLTAMFNQTRKAFTIGLGNVDYQDAGRTAMELITRDLEQMVPCNYGLPTATNAGVVTYEPGVNFYLVVSPKFFPVAWPTPTGDTNVFTMDRLYLLNRYSQQWNAIGYTLLPTETTNGVGTLYRYVTNGVNPTNLAGIYNADPLSRFTSAATNVESRVVDGVVDFRIRAFDRNGVLIPNPNLSFDYPSNNPVITSRPMYPNSGSGQYVGLANRLPQVTNDFSYVFYSNAVPAYVEVELGIMESTTLARLQALTNSAGNPTGAYWQYLTSHAGQVHIFRQRVTISAANPAVYP
jgi:Prokaryotic N-terminal methylation motif